MAFPVCFRLLVAYLVSITMWYPMVIETSHWTRFKRACKIFMAKSNKSTERKSTLRPKSKGKEVYFIKYDKRGAKDTRGTFKLKD